MNIERDVPLHNQTTFKIGGNASYFALVKTADDLKDAIAFAQKEKLPWLILGGGSNVLIADQGYAGLVIKLEIKGIAYNETGDEVLVTAGAGENWDDFVALCVSRGLYGLENLSGIPGTVGAAPVQNIGAYGVEVKDIVSKVTVFDTEVCASKEIIKSECVFEYRDSIFKKPEGKKYVITSVTFALKKNGVLRTDYKDVHHYFDTNKTTPTLSTLRDAILEIRKGKFPDLREHGTAGSFFKNPIILKNDYEKIVAKYPAMPKYDIDESHVKIPLAWILDNVCNVKGIKNGNVGQYEKQALVLVNFGGATAKEVKDHAAEIIACVKEKTGIEIEPEVQFV